MAVSASNGVARASARRWGLPLVVLAAVGPLATGMYREVDVLAAGTVYTVDSTGDQNDSNLGDGNCRTSVGTCTLRAAIREANYNSGHDRIEFDIPGGGPHTIRPDSAYALITDPSGVTIDGYTQPGSSVNTLNHSSNAVIKIQLEGRGPTAFDGIDIRSGGGVVRGLALYDFRLHIRFWGPNANSNEVIGNFIGTNAAGTFGQTRRWLNSTGVQLERGASSNRIGKPGNQDRNVISGTGDRGVASFDDDTDANLIQNNLIGLNPSGTGRLANWGHGVDVNYNSSFNIVGGTGAGEGNVISGNQLSGVEISHIIGSDDTTATQGNQVVNNLIGTNPTGTAAPDDFRNREHGVNLEGKGACPVWCRPDIRRNVVSGNVIVGSRAGVMIWKAAFDNEVLDNVIGVLGDGSPAQSSAQSIWGVLIEAGAFDNRVEGNLISGVPTGVQVRPDNNYPATSNPRTFPTYGNTITKNSIYNIGPGFAIDLWPVGSINTGANATPSDVQHGVSLPSISSPDTASVTVATCADCVVELFLADYDCPTSDYSCSSHGQGRVFVVTQTANSSGIAEFVLRDEQSDPYVLFAGDQIAATTTSPLGSTSEFSARVTVSEGPIPPPDPSDQHVVHISVDGLNATMLADLMASDPVETDAWHRLANEGASTFNARTDVTRTNTLPNNTSMITARPVEQPAGFPNTTQHGWTSNDDPPPGATLHNAGNPNLGYLASTFDVAHDNGLSTAAFVSKSKFKLFDVSYDAANGAPDVTGPDDGADKIDTYFHDDDSATTHAALVSDLAANDYGYTFVHYRDPDSAGHNSNWGSAEYFDALRDVNDYLAGLLTTIETDPQLSGRTAVIVTSDHGGGDPPGSHLTVSAPANYTIPVFVWGPGVAAGADLYALNGGRADPGVGQPTYTAPGQPIRNGETGTLALDLLGLPPIAGTLMSDPLNVVPRTGNSAPVVTSPGVQSSTIGAVVSLGVVATDVDGDVLSFGASGLPDGLSIGSADGVISGTATTAGVFAVTVTASDGAAVGQATFGWTVTDSSPPTGVLEVRVSSGTDDVEEITATGEMYFESSDLELIDDSSYKGVQTVGMRFNGVVVPAGSTITNAYLEFQADETDAGTTSLEFRAQAADSAALFGSAAFDLSNRSVTAAAVSWSNVPAWNTVGQKHQTPDLSAVVQEVIDGPGWSSGNSVVIAVTGSGRRVAESANGDATNAPLLHIEYTDGTPGNSVPVVTSPAPQTSTVGDVVSLGVVATDADGDVLSFVASGLPDGLSIGTTDGVISGTATTAGVFAVTVTASDGAATGQATFGWTVADPSPPTGTVEVRVSSGNDDVEEVASTGEMYFESSDLELVDDSSYKGVQSVGMRFIGVAVPAGSTITNAFVEFQADETDTGQTSLQFRAQATDDAGPFTATAFELTTRPMTAALVSWSNVPSWNTIGQKHQTPNLSAVVQEVVNRPGWTAGNSVVIAVTGSGRRVAESANGDATSAPLLHIEYTSTTPGNSAPVVTSPGEQSSVVGDVVSLGVVATDVDGDVLSFSASGLPDGLSIGATDGVISGAVTTSGVFAVTVTVDDGAATGQATFGWTVNDPSPPTGVLEVRVSSGVDDVEEIAATGEMYFQSSDLELIDDSSYKGVQTVGMRFNGVVVPAGSTITAAYLEFQADEADTRATSLAFRAQAGDDAAPFGSAAFDLSNRSVTAAAVSWSNVPAWNTVGQKHQTPDLSAVVQEVIGRPGWSSGNSVVIAVTGSGRRVAESANGDATNAPLLHIEYTTL